MTHANCPGDRMSEGAGFDLHTTAQHLISYIFDKDSLQYSCLENTREVAGSYL